MSESRPARIVLTTFGSLGDLHPYITLARALQSRGHDVLLATQNSFGEKVAAAGIAFHPVGPDIADFIDEFGSEQALMAHVMDQRRGPEFVIRRVLMPHLRRTYEEVSAAAAGADLLITHPLTLAAHLVAEKQRDRMAWVSVALSPSMLWSAHDPPVLAPLPALNVLHPLGAMVFRPLFALMKRGMRSWVQPWHELRQELGLPPTKRSPMFDAQFSPQMTLALFSPLMAAPQPDWPPDTRVTGFMFDDERADAAAMPAELERFLESGDEPIVFTLGSSAVMTAGDFYTQSIAAAERLGRRAVLLTGRDERNRPAGPLPAGVAAFEYAPYSKLLPRAAAVVHQGGIGTTAEALRAGRPMLIVPFGFDQPDNAARAVKLGVARTISRKRYTGACAAAELSKLLDDPSYATRARTVGQQIAHENGPRAACDAVEALLGRG